MSTFPKADTKAQWFEDNYPGSPMHLQASNAVLVIHTTEGMTWPGYSGGSIAPNITGHPNIAKKSLAWRQHFPYERSSRALENHPGGVETNTLNVIQVELVGTCDPAHRSTWSGKRAGRDYIYWPDAPDWALREVAALVLDIHKRFGLRLDGPKFKAYPGSYGANNGVRLTMHEWNNFNGICGHQHVPENDHGDPGDFPIERVLAFVSGSTPPAHVPAPAPKKPGSAPKPTRVSRFVEECEALIEKYLDPSVEQQHRIGDVKTMRDAIRSALARGPRR